MPRGNLARIDRQVRTWLYREDRNSTEKFSDAHAHFTFCEMLTQAEVRAAAKAEVAVRLACKHGFARVFEFIRIEIPSHRVTHYEIAGLNLHATNFMILGCHAAGIYDLDRKSVV